MFVLKYIIKFSHYIKFMIAPIALYHTVGLKILVVGSLHFIVKKRKLKYISHYFEVVFVRNTPLRYGYWQ